MLYQAYQVHSDIMVPVRSWAPPRCARSVSPWRGVADNAVLRNLSAAYELIARAGLTHARPAFGIDSVTVGNREVAVHEHAALTTPFGTLLHFKKDIDIPQPRVLWSRRCRAISRRFCAAPCAPCCPSTTSTSPTGTMLRDVPLIHGRFGFDEYIEHLISFLEAHRSGRPCGGGVPALRGRARRRGGDGAGRQCRAAPQHDLDGGSDRHPRQSDQGQRARQFEADRVVRAQSDRLGAVALSGCIPPGLSGLRAARRVHEHECRAPCEGASRAVRQPRQGRA